MDEREDSVTQDPPIDNPAYPKARLVCGQVELLITPLSVLLRYTEDRVWQYA